VWFEREILPDLDRLPETFRHEVDHREPAPR
jgi:hypothetical protein